VERNLDDSFESSNVEPSRSSKAKMKHTNLAGGNPRRLNADFAEAMVTRERADQWDSRDNERVGNRESEGTRVSR